MKNPHTKTTRTLLLVAGLAVVTACAPESGPGQFYREAGSQVDSGEFGNATLHNQLTQTCRTNGVGTGVGKVGAPPSDPLVVLDPTSKPGRTVYRVHCDGQLDGKFAQIVYREYVTSGIQSPNVQQADAE